MDAQNFRTRILRGMGQLDLTIQSSRAQQRRIEDVRSIGGGDDLDHVVRTKTVQLTQQFEHGALHLPVAALIPPESLRADRVQLVDEYDRSAGGPVGYFFLGELERVPDELRAVPDEHLHELRTRQLQEDGVRLVGARAGEEGLPRPGRSVQEHPLGGFDADGVEHVFVGHGEDDGLDELLDLFVRAADVGIFLGGSLVHLHGLDAGVEFGGKLFEDEVRILVRAHEVRGLELVGIHEARHGKVNRLTGRRLDDGAPGLALRVHVGGAPLLHLLVLQPVLRLRLENLHDISHEVRKLLVQFDLLDVLPDALPLPPALVLDPLDVAAEYADFVVDELDALAELGRGHGRRLVVDHVLVLVLRGRVVVVPFGLFAGRAAAAGCGLVVFVAARIAAAAAGVVGVSPDIGSLEVIGHDFRRRLIRFLNRVRVRTTLN
mmetsp:Transcript_16790/g.40142  ORF Transcript_16790/g.40142 Transcript_16790/m.40142 type:complete len:433 (-) Transcript_16790:29-1327(-)